MSVVLPITGNGAGRGPGAGDVPPQQLPRRGFPWRAVVVVLFVLVIAGAVLAVRMIPAAVLVVHPRPMVIVQTIAATGTVVGKWDAGAGASATGRVTALYVREGAHVAREQTIARLDDAVDVAEIAQAQSAALTARAQYEQLLHPKPADVAAARAAQAQAVAQRDAQGAMLAQAQRGVGAERSRLADAVAQRDASALRYRRAAMLLGQGFVAASAVDDARAELASNEARAAAQRRTVEQAQAVVRSTQAAMDAARANVDVLAARLGSVLHASPQELAVAQRRIDEADAAVVLARQTNTTTYVKAPFDGTVVELRAQPGQFTTTEGVVRLISTATEIHADVDESNLPMLAAGQTAELSLGVGTRAFPGRLVKIGSSVDVSRGTVTLTLWPSRGAPKLRPGQTVNVNVIVLAHVRRLLIPQSALAGTSDHGVVYAVRDGHIVALAVRTIDPTDRGVPVVDGVRESDAVVVDSQSVTAGQTARPRWDRTNGTL